MAVLALSTLGAAIGSTIGGTLFGISASSIGWTLGGLLGNALFGPSGPNVQGPRLEDLSAGSANEGASIPMGWGNPPRIPSQVLVANEITEVATTTSTGGKSTGGSTYTEYTYFQTFAVAFGNLRPNNTGQLRRVWANKILIYDATPNADATQIDGLHFTWYDGSQTAADPTLEALIGTGNVQAYKGLAYIVFDEMPLAKFGNRTPVVEVEVVTNGTSSVNVTSVILDTEPKASLGNQDISAYNDMIVCTIVGGPLKHSILRVVDPYSKTLIYSIDFAIYSSLYHRSVSPSGYTGYGTQVLVAEGAPSGIGDAHLYVLDATNDFIATSSWVDTKDASYLGAESDSYVLLGSGFGSGLFYWIKGTTSSDNEITMPSGWEPAARIPSVHVGGNVWLVALQTTGAGTPGISVVTTGGAAAPIETLTGITAIFNDPVADDNGVYWWAITDGVYDYLWGTDATGVVVDAVDITGHGAWSSSAGYPVIYYDPTTRSIYWHNSGAAHSWNILSRGFTDYPTDSKAGAWPTFHAPTGTLWCGTYDDTGGGTGDAVTYAVKLNAVATVAYPVEDIITDILGMAGITSAHYDVSEITAAGITIGGFAHTSQCSARADLDPLLQISLIDAFSSEYKLKFNPLGGSIEGTITASDMGCREFGSDQKPPLEVVEPKSTDLPREMVLDYISSDRDLQPASALSTWYVGDSSKNANIRVPATMTDDQAAERSQQLLQLTHGSVIFKTSLPRRYDEYDPTDPVYVYRGDGTTVRTRILQMDRGANGIINMTLQQDNPEDLNADYVTGGSGVDAQTILASSPPVLLLMDTNLLRDLDDDHPGPYMTAFTYGSAFPGVGFYQSVDNQNFVYFNGITQQPDVFRCATVPSAVDFEDWDDTNTLNVTTVTDSTLSSITETATKAGGNAALWGKPGRWELIYFQTATLVTAGEYNLTHILRGRRGTDYYMDQHEADDWLVMLDENAAVRCSITVGSIGLPWYFKAPKSGQAIVDANTKDWTVGVNPIKPYSPINLAGADNGTTPANKDITWDWRVRRGGTLGGTNTLTDGVGNTLTDNDAGYLRVLHSDLTTVLNTYAVTGESRTYTLAEQVADYGTVPSAAYFQIAQTNSDGGTGFWSAVYELAIAALFTYYGEVILNAPVAYWRLGEATGTTATDDAGSNDGTYVNTPTQGAASLDDSDTSNTAVTFDDASSEHIRVNGYKGILGTGPIAAEILFVCTGNTGSAQFFLNWGTDGPGGGHINFNIQTSGGQILVGIGGGSRQGSFSVIDSKKHHAMCILGATAADTEIYLDGERYDDTTVGTGTQVRNITSGNDLGIGATDVDTTPTSFFRGTLDEPAIYNTQLTAMDALRHAVAAFGTGYFGDVKRLWPIGYWRLGDLTGTTAADAMGSNDGTYNGTYTLAQGTLLEGDADTSVSFTDGYVNVPYFASLANIQSVEMTIKLGSATGTRCLVACHNSSSSLTGFTIYQNAGSSISVQMKDGSGSVASASAAHGKTAPGDRLHIVVKWTGFTTSDHFEIWLDGQLVTTSSNFSAAWSIGSWPLRMAKSTDTTTWAAFDGTMDEVSVYDYELSTNQVQDHALRAVFADYETLAVGLSPNGYWRLGEASGTSAADSSGNSHAGTYVGTPTLGADGALHSDNDTAVTLNGTTQYVNIADHADFDFTTACTLAGWFKISSAPSISCTLIGKDPVTGSPTVRPYTLYYATSSNSLLFYAKDGANARQEQATLPTGTDISVYHHYAVTFSSGTVVIYLDGVALSSTPLVTGLTTLGTDSTDLRIGNDARGSGSAYLTGSADEVAVFPAALTAGQINALYRKGIH